MKVKRILPFVFILLTALLLELTVFQASFWKTIGNEGKSITPEVIFGHVEMEDMVSVDKAWSEGKVWADEAGYTHVSCGEILIRLRNVDCQVEQLALALSLPENGQAKMNVFMRDEGNFYTYQLGNERQIWEWVPESKCLLLYPYGEVKDIFITLTAAQGQELIYRLDDVLVNGQMPFRILGGRLCIAALLLMIAWSLRVKSGLHKYAFWPEGCSGRAKKQRLFVIVACTLFLVTLSAASVLVNPVCRQNLGMHHAQYQELAVALSQGETAVGVADERLEQVENPYDTIYLQADQIPYQADYAYKDGKYYVYFGIVPELLCYLPCYLLTGRALPNYLAMLFFCTGFVISCAGAIYELMRSRFGNVPFYLYPVCIFMLVFAYPLFYMQIRPDLYHVPIAASCMFTALSLWLVLAGSRMEKARPWLWGAGALCIALNAGCRPQFLLFSVLLIPLCVPYLLDIFLKKKQVRTLIAMAVPYLAVAAGIMYYNAVRFGSPFDFGATYSMTSNDMTHRGFNLSRIIYSAWYYLFGPPQMEGTFPYLQSAAIETDYAGRLVSESCFGGIFACSMLYWPVFSIFCCNRRLREKKLAWVAWLGIFVSLMICAADASGAGVLQRYMADQMLGFGIAAVILLCVIAEWAYQRGCAIQFAGWIRAALFLHIAFLALVLINTDSSVNISSGNPQLYAAVWSWLQF